METQEGDVEVDESQDSVLWLLLLLQEGDVCGQDSAETMA